MTNGLGATVEPFENVNVHPTRRTHGARSVKKRNARTWRAARAGRGARSKLPQEPSDWEKNRVGWEIQKVEHGLAQLSDPDQNTHTHTHTPEGPL